MTTYFITLLLVFVFTFVAQNNIVWQTNESNLQLTAKKTNTTKTFYILASLVLILVAGLRYDVGTDYLNYLVRYDNSVKNFVESLLTLDEPGYKFICWFSNLIGGDGLTALFLASTLTIFLFLKTIYKNTYFLLPAVLLYIFLGCWHGAFNGIRQYLAAAIIFSGVRFIKERKFWKYALIVFIAFLFHVSAILMLFPYFIANNKISLPNILFLIGASIVVLFSFSEILTLAGFILNDNVTNAGVYLTQSVNILRILVAIAPALFFLLIYQRRTITKERQFWINMLIINAVMMIATSNSAYLARMGIYTVTFSAVGIPELVDGLGQKDKKFIGYTILFLFFAFWVYSIYSSSLNHFTFIWQKS